MWRTFWASVPPVADALDDSPGLMLRVGIGEAPVGLQGTFSVWDVDGGACATSPTAAPSTRR